MSPTLNPQRQTTAQILDGNVSMLAKITMGVLDGVPRHGKFPPTAMHVALRIRQTLRAKVEDPTLGPAYNWDGLGVGLKEYLGMVVLSCSPPELRIECDELLRDYYQRCVDFVDAREAAGDPIELTPENIANVAAQVFVLDWDDEAGDGTGMSLWARYMLAAYPWSKRTPGGPNWNPDAQHFTSPNFWAGADPLAPFKV